MLNIQDPAHLQRQYVVHGRGAEVVIGARLCDSREEVVQIERHDRIIDVDVPRTGRQHLQSRFISPFESNGLPQLRSRCPGRIAEITSSWYPM